MKYIQGTKGFIIQSERDPTKFYTVSLELSSCTCPAFKYFTRGQPCKHIRFIQEDLGSNFKEKEKQHGGYEIKNGDEAWEFVNRYGEDVLQNLKNNGEVFEKNGKLFRL